MPVIQVSQRVHINYPTDWPTYLREALEDRKKLRLPERPEGNAFTSEELRGLVCDTSGTLLDYSNNLIPGVKELLEALKKQGGFTKIEVTTSGESDCLSAIEAALGDTHLVDNFAWADTPKREYAATTGSTFALEDEGNNTATQFLLRAIPPRRQVWNMGIAFRPRNYDNELIGEIVQAYSAVRTELEKLQSRIVFF